MTLTSAQKAALIAAIQADTAANAFYVAGDLTGLANYMNGVAAPAFIVWKTNVTLERIGDAFVATEVAGLTSLNVQRLEVMATYGPSGINPSKADRRAAFDDIFSGAGGVGTRTALSALWRRSVTRFERVFATGTGTTGTPGSLVVEASAVQADGTYIGTVSFEVFVGL